MDKIKIDLVGFLMVLCAVFFCCLLWSQNMMKPLLENWHYSRAECMKDGGYYTAEGTCIMEWPPKEEE